MNTGLRASGKLKEFLVLRGPKGIARIYWYGARLLFVVLVEYTDQEPDMQEFPQNEDLSIKDQMVEAQSWAEHEVG